MLVLKQIKCLSYACLLDVLLHTSLDSSFLSRILLFVLFNLGSFLYGQIFAELSVNVKPMENQWWLLFWLPLMQKIMQITDFKISVSWAGSVSWFHPVLGIEERTSY